jgi:hypothetical protein
MSVPVYGSPPEFTGRMLDAVRLQGFVSRGVLVPGATVVYLKIEGAWYRVAVDHGTVHWHREEMEPKTWSVPEQGWEYPVRDFPGAHEILGVPIASVSTSGGSEEACVAFLFENGRKLVFAGTGDENAVSAV